LFILRRRLLVGTSVHIVAGCRQFTLAAKRRICNARRAAELAQGTVDDAFPARAGMNRSVRDAEGRSPSMTTVSVGASQLRISRRPNDYDQPVSSKSYVDGARL